jgi:hypothetical protein
MPSNGCNPKCLSSGQGGGGFYQKPLFQVKLPIDSLSVSQQKIIAAEAREYLREKLPQLDFIVTNHGVEINRIL